MDNLTGDVKGYEKMADNYIETEEAVAKKAVDEKEVKKLVAKLSKDYKAIEDNLNKLRELKAHKELYDASTSLDNFKESFEKISLIYN